MNIVRKKIKDLNPATYNPRIITDDEYEGLKNSLRTFGLVEPIVINKDNTIIGGHQRTRAWEELGNTEIDCYIVDLDKKLEKKLNVVLNSHAISGKYDDILLGEVLEELKLDDDYFDLKLDRLETVSFDDLNEQTEIDSEEKDIYSVTIRSKNKLDFDTFLNKIKQIKNDNDLDINISVRNETL